MMGTWQSDTSATWIMLATPIFAERVVSVTTAYGRGCGLGQPARSEPRPPASRGRDKTTSWLWQSDSQI